MQKLELTKVYNARDLGGTPTEDGRRIKPGRLIRSEALPELTKEDIHTLCVEHGLKAIIDLRTLTEREEKPDQELEGVENLHIPIFPEEVVGISRGKKTTDSIADNWLPDMRINYRMMVSDPAAIGQFKRVIGRIMEQKEGAILWHCTAGKDRCGMTSVYIERLLGMDMELIREDYLRTNIAAAPFAEKIHDFVLEKSGNKEQALWAKKAFLAEPDYFDAAMDEMEKLYGGIDGFLEKGLGISREEREEFKNNILE